MFRKVTIYFNMSNIINIVRVLTMVVELFAAVFGSTAKRKTPMFKSFFRSCFTCGFVVLLVILITIGLLAWTFRVAQAAASPRGPSSGEMLSSEMPSSETFSYIGQASIGQAGILPNDVKTDTTRAYDIVLISDQSPFMMECNGEAGSAPELRRLEAAQLFIDYLGADSSHAQYCIALLHFGGEVQTVSSFVDLADSQARAELSALAGEIPTPISWTDPLLALETAQTFFEVEGANAT